MGEIGTILQNAIINVAGNEGMEKFTKAGYDPEPNRITRPDGSLDVPLLMNILLGVFPEDKATAITDNVLAMYVGTAGEDHIKAPGAGKGDREAGGEAYEENLAKYLSTEASDVRDLINEARRIRMAMGKPVTVKAATPPGPENMEPDKIPPVSIAPTIVHEMEGLKPDPIEELNNEMLETEIRKMVMVRKAYTSVDIMDFIRYLKDKGYNFQENIVLEDVYTRLEERKSREKAALMVDIHVLIDRLPWPTESEVAAFIEQKKGEGVLFDGPEIKRMILVEMIRNH